MGKYDDYAKGAKNWEEGSYNSDEDLPDETQQKIKDQEGNQNYSAAQKTRSQGWENAGAWPKLKRMVKGSWSKDSQS